MSAQRYCVCEQAMLRTCKLCGEASAIVRKLGRPREFCWSCEPPGWQRVWLSDGRYESASGRHGCR